MFNRKGFSLIELIIVLLIISALAAVAIPNIVTSRYQGITNAALNNLVTIYGAEKNFYLSNGYYCATSNQSPNCADTLADLNLPANLNLNITDSNFAYACTDPAGDSGAGTTFTCTTTISSIPGFTLTLSNNPIVLPGGAGSPNPVCAPSGSVYCPSAAL